MQAISKLNHLLVEFHDNLSMWEQVAVKEMGFTLSQMQTIKVLGDHDTLKMTALAKKLSITTGTLTVQVDKLVKAGVIERCAQQNDRRSVLIKLTENGLALCQSYTERHNKLTQDLTRHVNSKQRDVLITCLEKMGREF